MDLRLRDRPAWSNTVRFWPHRVIFNTHKRLGLPGYRWKPKLILRKHIPPSEFKSTDVDPSIDKTAELVYAKHIRIGDEDVYVDGGLLIHLPAFYVRASSLPFGFEKATPDGTKNIFWLFETATKNWYRVNYTRNVDNENPTWYDLMETPKDSARKEMRLSIVLSGEVKRGKPCAAALVAVYESNDGVLYSEFRCLLTVNRVKIDPNLRSDKEFYETVLLDVWNGNSFDKSIDKHIDDIEQRCERLLRLRLAFCPVMKFGDSVQWCIG